MTVTHGMARAVALLLATASLAALLYVGLYQSRVVEKMWCPLLGGCEAVADASFAHPYGIPDGYIGAGLYAAMLTLVMASADRRPLWVALLALGALATYANVKGVWDMARIGAFCTYCIFTTAASPLLLWMIWRLRRA